VEQRTFLSLFSVVSSPSFRSVNQSHGGSWAVIIFHSGQARGSAIPPFIWGVSLSKATSMFARHLCMASIESATSSALVSQSRSSGSADRKIRPDSFSWSLNCEGFFKL